MGANIDQRAVVAIMAEDFNGSLYIGAQEGEELVDNPLQHVIMLKSGAQSMESAVAYDSGEANDFIVYNTLYLKFYADTNQPVITMNVAQASDVAYLRLLGVKNALISDRYLPNANFVTYNDAKLTTIQDVANIPGMPGVDQNFLKAIQDNLTPARRLYLRSHFTDLLGLTGVLFKGRGHHNGDDVDVSAMKIWTKARYESKALNLTWAMVGKFAFHAVYPNVLEKFLMDSAAANKLNGAIAKRADTYPAGAAIIGILRVGVADLASVATGIKTIQEGPLRDLTALFADYDNQPLAYSVNARYYGHQRKRVNEARMGVLAAMLLSALNVLAPDSQMANSPALKRVAQNAMLTGAVFGQAVANLPRDPRITGPLISS